MENLDLIVGKIVKLFLVVMVFLKLGMGNNVNLLLMSVLMVKLNV